MTLLSERNDKTILICTTIDDSCEHWLDMKKMTITSPDYPKWYKANGVGCEWTVIAPKGNIISIEFIKFHVGA